MGAEKIKSIFSHKGVCPLDYDLLANLPKTSMFKTAAQIINKIKITNNEKIKLEESVHVSNYKLTYLTIKCMCGKMMIAMCSDTQGMRYCFIESIILHS